MFLRLTRIVAIIWRSFCLAPPDAGRDTGFSLRLPESQPRYGAVLNVVIHIPDTEKHSDADLVCTRRSSYVGKGHLTKRKYSFYTQHNDGTINLDVSDARILNCIEIAVDVMNNLL